MSTLLSFAPQPMTTARLPIQLARRTLLRSIRHRCPGPDKSILIRDNRYQISPLHNADERRTLTVIGRSKTMYGRHNLQQAMLHCLPTWGLEWGFAI